MAAPLHIAHWEFPLLLPVPAARTISIPLNGIAPPGTSCGTCGRPAEWAYAGRFLFCDPCASHEVEGRGEQDADSVVSPTTSTGCSSSAPNSAP